MHERLRLHPERPQKRQIERAADLLRQGCFAVVPTETTYALMALPGSTEAQEAIRRVRKLDERHLWALACLDLSQAANYSRIDNSAHRLLRRCLPGPYTFILPASSTLPKRIFGKRRDIGIRMPEAIICRALLEQLGEPLLTTSCQLPGMEVATDPDLLESQLKGYKYVLLDAGWGGTVPTTVVDLCCEEPELFRQGAGEWPA